MEGDAIRDDNFVSALGATERITAIDVCVSKYATNAIQDADHLLFTFDADLHCASPHTGLNPGVSGAIAIRPLPLFLTIKTSFVPYRSSNTQISNGDPARPEDG